MNLHLRNDLSLIRRLLFQVRSEWMTIVCIYILDLLASPLALMIPVPLMVAVNCVLGDKPMPSGFGWLFPKEISNDTRTVLIVLSVMIFCITLLIQLRHMASRMLQAYVGERLTLKFRSQLLSHSQSLSLAYHDREGVADAIYRIQYDAPAIQWIIIYGLAPFGSAVLTVVGMLAVTAAIDFELAIIALIVMPVLMMLVYVFRRRLRSQWLIFKELEASALELIQEVLSALRLVKVFGQERRENDRFLDISTKGIQAQFRVVVLETTFSLLVALTIAVGTATVLFLGVLHVLDGKITLGALLLVMSYLAQLYLPLESMGKQLTKLQGCLASAQRAFSLLDLMPEVNEITHARPLNRAIGGIEFKGVSFCYDPGHTVLDNVNFKIPPGVRVGVLGKTGAGKSTLVNLLMRLYSPRSGAIYLDDVDVSKIKLSDLRNQFALVMQEPVLLSSSIAENIAYGRPSASMNEIAAAARAANVDEFVHQFRDGYQAQVGDRGLSLSGGQRQRIAIARALLKDAPILVLDEPTSAVDAHTERKIVDAMSRLMKGRTTLLISHRGETLRQCDLLLKVKDTHCELLDVSALDGLSL